MEQDMIIPKDVRETPAGPNGNGFMVGDILTEYIIGLDGKIYIRKDGKIFVPSDFEDT